GAEALFLSMTRRDLLSATAALSISQALGRAEEFPGTRYREYSRCLPDYLRRLAADAYERRNGEILKLTSAPAIAPRQKWVEQTFWNLTGGKPASTPLHVQQTGGFDRAGYRLERLIYQSQPEIY